jgi:DNA-binding FadR family transcriptional regulator
LILEVQDNPEVLRRMVLAMNELRSALEPEIAALAATAATDEQRATLRALLERMEERPDNLLELDVAFHLELARATQNPLFVHVIESVRNLLQVSVERRADYVQRELEGVPPYHRLIFEAVEARDADAARKAMREHMAMAGPIWTSEQG